MNTLHPQFLVDEQGILQRVVLDITEFKALMEAAGQQIKEPEVSDVLRVNALGWAPEETLDTRTRLQSFEEDWNAPGMEYYDNL